MRILLVEDDKILGQGVKTLLEIEGFETVWAPDGKAALEEFEFQRQNGFDVILLDWMLPELSGIEICKYLRNQRRGNFNGGIIFLTAKAELDDCVEGLEAGADDYITKPFEIKELIARIYAVARRKNKPYVDDIYEFGGLVLNGAERTLALDGEIIRFSHTEFKILQILFVNHGRTILRETLFEKVWGDNPEISNANLDSYIYNIRKKIKPWNHKINIVLLKNLGYTLEIK